MSSSKVAMTDLAVLDFADFGKERIKQHKISPDAFCQMAAQIASYRTLYFSRY